MSMMELRPRYDERKSFYGKAKVETVTAGGEEIFLNLYSYGTLVARIMNFPDEKRAEVYNLQSATTLRHVKEFLKQNDFPADSKGDIIKRYFKET